MARKALLMCVLQINISFENHLDLENTHETTPSYNFLPVSVGRPGPWVMSP